MRPSAILLIASTLYAAGAGAQSKNPNRVFGLYQQTIWQERDGLPQRSVLAVTTTRDGYLWLGTYEGAARFDGVRFTRFTTGNTTGLGNSLVTGLLETRNGDLWLATFGGGVSRFSDGRFTHYGVREGLSNDLTKCLLEDRAGTLWIGTDGGGVSSFRDGRFSTYTTADGLPGDLVRVLIEDADGSVLAGTSGGIARIAHGRVTAYPSPAPFAHADIQTLARMPDGSLWVAPVGDGIYRVDAAGVRKFGVEHGLSARTVESILVDRDGVVWIGSLTDGLFRYADGRFEQYTSSDGLPGGRVAAIVKASASGQGDRDEGLWLGTDGGLVQLKRPRVTVYTERDGLASDYVGSVIQDKEGRVWVASGNGLTRYTNGTFKVFTTRDGLPSDRIRGIALGADGLPLVYTPSGAVRWTEGRFARIASLRDISWPRVTSLLEDRAGTFWVGSDDGLYRVRDGRTTLLTRRDGLADDSVLTLFEDRDGSIWVGTSRNGITRIAGGQMTSWSTGAGLASTHVKVFHRDAAGTLWIGTHGGGLSRFRDGVFTTIAARHGLHSDDIFQILEDDEANLWMNSNTGVWRTSLAQLNEVADGRRAAVESFAYGAADGMLSSEGAGGNPAGWKMRDGSLWFPTTKGIVALHPRRGNPDPPRVLIEGITVDRVPVAAGGRVRLMPGQQQLEIQYTGISWSRPHAIRFRFMLEGLDRGWVEAGARRTAYYSYLPPGSYTFRVTADNGEGVWNETGTSLAVLVLPEFHQTWWFRAAAASSVAGLVWLTWRYRAAQMRAAQASQQAFSRQLIESQERERQRIAAELHDSLGQNLLVVKNRALLGALSQTDEHALKQFNEIGATVAQTLEEVRAISYNLRPHHLDQLGLTTTIGAMIGKIAESAAIPIESRLDDIDGIFPPDDEITIYRIIQECLNNIVKHSHAREAYVTVRRRERELQITIHDNGRGFVSKASDGVAPYGGGFGLTGIAQRVSMLGGTHTIESFPGRGTTVTVLVGLKVPRHEVRHGG